MTPPYPDSPYAFWTDPKTAFTVTYPIALMREIEVAADDGFRKIRHGGIEVGGILLGRHAENGARLEAFRPIACEYRFGPSFRLSDSDIERLKTQLTELTTDPELDGLRPIGFFVSHTRGPLLLTDSESTILDEFFPGEGKLAVLVKPDLIAQPLFSFLIRGDDGQVERDGRPLAIRVPTPEDGTVASAAEPIASIAAPVEVPVSAVQAEPIEAAVPESLEVPLAEETVEGELPDAEASQEEPIALGPAFEETEAEPAAGEFEPLPLIPEEPLANESLAELPTIPEEFEAEESEEEEFDIIDAEVIDVELIEPPLLADEPVAVEEQPLEEAPEPQPEAKLDREAEPEREVQPAPEQEVQSEPETEIHAEPDTEVQREPETERQPGPEHVSLSEPEPPLLAEAPSPVLDTLPEPEIVKPPEPKVEEEAPKLEEEKPKPEEKPKAAETEQKAAAREKAPPSEPPFVASDFNVHADTRDQHLEARKKLQAVRLRWAAVLALAALLGSSAGYWLYSQLPPAIIPLRAQSQPPLLTLSWPAETTRDAAWAGIRIDNGQPIPLSNADKEKGQAQINVQADNVKVELIAQHWMRDSHGIVRFINGMAPQLAKSGTH